MKHGNRLFPLICLKVIDLCRFFIDFDLFWEQFFENDDLHRYTFDDEIRILLKSSDLSEKKNKNTYANFDFEKMCF